MKKYLFIGLLLHLQSFGQDFQEKKELRRLFTLQPTASVLNQIALNLNYLNELDSSMAFSKKAFVMASRQKNAEETTKADLNIAIILQKNGRYLEATEYYEKAIKSAPNDSLLAMCYHFLGTCYKDQSILDKTLETQQKALVIAQERGLKDIQIRCLNTQGLTFLRQNRYYTKALKVFKEALLIANQLHNDLHISILHKNIGWVHLLWHEEKTGLAHLNKAIAIQQSSNEARVHQNLFYSYIVLVQYYTTVKKDYPQSNLYALKALDLSEKAHWIEENSDVYHYLYLNAKSLGNIEEAMQYLEKYQFLSEKLNEDKLRIEKAIAEEKLKSSTLELENKRKEDQRNGLLIGLLIALSAGFLIFQLYTTIRKQNRKIEGINHNLEIKVQERTAELQQAYNEIKEAMLRGQTLERKRVAADLHDNLGSMLSAVGVSMEVVNETGLSEHEQLIFTNIKKQLDEAYREVRLLSHNLQPAELEKEGLYNALELLAEKINGMGKIKLELDLEVLTPQSRAIEFSLYSICLEAINNIIKHSKASLAKIAFERTDKQLIMKITDNGIGFKADGKNGVGLQNIQSRVEQIGGQMTVNSVNGTVIEIRVYS